jgi:hypothetical protein
MSTPREHDSVYSFWVIVLAAIAGWCAPTGWGWTVFIAVVVCSPERRIRINSDPDDR